MRNSRRGGVGFTLTDDRRVLAGPQNRRSSFSGPVGLSAPYQRDPVASRHTIYVHWLFRRHRTVWPLLPTGLKTQQFSLRYTRNTGQPHTHTTHTHTLPNSQVQQRHSFLKRPCHRYYKMASLSPGCKTSAAGQTHIHTQKNKYNDCFLHLKVF